MSNSENWTPSTEAGFKAMAEFLKLKQKHEKERERLRNETESDSPDEHDPSFSKPEDPDGI